MADTPRYYKLGESNPALTGPRQGRVPSGPVMASRPGPPTPLPDIQEVERLVSRELEQWEKDLRPLINRVNANWAKWNLQPVGDDNPFLSNLQSSYPLYAVEQILPRIIGQAPAMSYTPLDSDRDSLIALILGKVVTSQMKRMGFEYESRDFVRQGLVAGYSIGKLYWDRRSAKQAVTNVEEHPIVGPEPDLGSFRVAVQGEEDVIICNEPRFETVNILDFVWPLWALSITQAPAVWQRRWLSMGELQDLQDRGVYQNVDQITSGDITRWQQAYDPQFNAQGLTVTPPVSDTSDPRDPNSRVEIHERWEDDRLTVIAARRICLRDEPNPFWHKRKPFIDFTPIPRPFQLHGQSIVDTIYDSNEFISTLTRQVSDAVTYLINPAFKSTEGIDWGNFVLQPGAHLDVPDTEDVQPLTLPNVNLGDALAWKQEIEKDMQKNSGVFDVSSGFGFGGTHTATGVSQIIQQATMRITEIVNVLDYRSMRPFGWMMEQLNAQYFEQSAVLDFSDDPAAQDAWRQLVEQEQPANIWDRVTRPFGKKPVETDTEPQSFYQIEPHMVKAQGRLDPIPEVGQDEQAMITQQRSDASQAAQAIAPILASPMNPIDMAALADWMLEKYGVPERTRKQIVKTPPAQQAAIQNEAAGQNGSSGPSGPSGQNAPTGAPVGAAGAAGGVGPYGMGPGR